MWILNETQKVNLASRGRLNRKLFNILHEFYLWRDLSSNYSFTLIPKLPAFEIFNLFLNDICK